MVCVVFFFVVSSQNFEYCCFFRTQNILSLYHGLWCWKFLKNWWIVFVCFFVCPEILKRSVNLFDVVIFEKIFLVKYDFMCNWCCCYNVIFCCCKIRTKAVYRILVYWCWSIYIESFKKSCWNEHYFTHVQKILGSLCCVKTLVVDK